MRELRLKSIFMLVTAALMISALSLPFIQLANSNDELVTMTEYVVKPIGQASSAQSSDSHSISLAETIAVQGYWNKQFVTISVSDSNSKYAAEISGIVGAAISGPRSQSNSNFTGWQTVYNAVISEPGKLPLNLIVNNHTNTSIKPDIYIHFTNDVGGNVGNARIAAITYLTIHRSDHSIVFANSTIFETDKLFEQGILLPVVAHELGHSIGIGHSSSKTSIMYPSLQSEAGKPIGIIGACEVAALNALYGYRVEPLAGSVSCAQ